MAPIRKFFADSQSMMLFAIGLTALTCLLALYVWANDNGWHFTNMSLYQVFPIFGLLAFSIMWSQYMIAAIKDIFGLASDFARSYFTYTSFLVLLAILLHPGILVAQRYKDGYGLPPGSYETYVAPMQKWIVILGSVSLLMFLAYELKHWFDKRSWWKYIVLLNDAAILAIFYHGLRLGQDVRSDWFQVIWYVYGILLAGALIYKYYLKFSPHISRKKI
jgi:hypothetical protein